MTRLALIFLTGCAAPDYSNPDLRYTANNPYKEAQRVLERKALDADQMQRVRLEALRVHRHRLATNQIVVMPPLPYAR